MSSPTTRYKPSFSENGTIRICVRNSTPVLSRLYGSTGIVVGESSRDPETSRLVRFLGKRVIRRFHQTASLLYPFEEMDQKLVLPVPSLIVCDLPSPESDSGTVFIPSTTHDSNTMRGWRSDTNLRSVMSFDTRTMPTIIYGACLPCVFSTECNWRPWCDKGITTTIINLSLYAFGVLIASRSSWMCSMSESSRLEWAYSFPECS